MRVFAIMAGRLAMVEEGLAMVALCPQIDLGQGQFVSQGDVGARAAF